MPIYRVKLVYKYKAIVEVEAENEKEALQKAQNADDIDEEFDGLYESYILSES